MPGSVGVYSQGWLPWMASKANTNWNVRANSNNALGMGYVWSNGGQNDEVSWDIWLDVGTWKFSIVCNKGPNYGIFSVQLNDVEKGTIDGYNGTSIVNIYAEITGITVAIAGLYTFKLKMATKNASSSDYRGDAISCAWIRTAGTGGTPAGTSTPGYTWQYLPWMGTKSTVGFTNRLQSSAYLGGGYLYNSQSAQNDEVSWDIWLDAGTYKFVLLHVIGSGTGIYSVQLDAVEKGTIDGYHGINQGTVYSELTGITVGTAGVKTFTVKMATKNASSTGYRGSPQSVAWIRTGA